jgi:hypothetical protein
MRLPCDEFTASHGQASRQWRLGLRTETTVSCRVSPSGVSHVIECPVRRPIKAVPTGVITEIFPCEMSASSG